MSKSGDMWLEAYEAAIERFLDGRDNRLAFMGRLTVLGCSRIEIGELICSLGMVGR